MSDVGGLEEVKHVVENFVEKYGEGKRAWRKLNAEVESIGRTEEDMEEDEYGYYTWRQPR